MILKLRDIGKSIIIGYITSRLKLQDVRVVIQTVTLQHDRKSQPEPIICFFRWLQEIKTFCCQAGVSSITTFAVFLSPFSTECVVVVFVLVAVVAALSWLERF